MACPKCGFEFPTSTWSMFKGCPRCKFGEKNYQMNKNNPVEYIKGLRKEMEELEVSSVIKIPKNPEDDPNYELESPF